MVAAVKFTKPASMATAFCSGANVTLLPSPMSKPS
jgi:hypothetical protein